MQNLYMNGIATGCMQCSFGQLKASFKKIKMAVKMHILHFKDTLLVQSCMHDKHVYKDHQRITLTFLPKKTRLLTFSKIYSIKLIIN